MTPDRAFVEAVARLLGASTASTTGGFEERHAVLLGWRYRLLVSTPGGRLRLRHWLDRHRTGSWALSPRAVREHVARMARYFGDPGMLAPVVEAFCLVPAPVRDVLLPITAILGVGAQLSAWTSPANLANRDDETPERIVNLSWAGNTEATCDRALHEIAHCWLGRVLAAGVPAVTVHGEAALVAMAREECGVSLIRADAAIAREEHLARALAYVWAVRP